MEFKDRLRQLRESTGKNQKECAKDLHVEYANYNKWENGKTPNFGTICRIANYFNVSTDYLLGRSDAQKPENEKAIKSLGLWERNIEFLSNGLDRRADEKDERTLLEVLNMMLSSEYFENLLLYTAKRTTPYNHRSATQWGDGRIQPVFISSTEPDGELMDAAHEKLAHDVLDSIIEDVGNKSVKAWYTNKKQDK